MYYGRRTRLQKHYEDAEGSRRHCLQNKQNKYKRISLFCIGYDLASGFSMLRCIENLRFCYDNFINEAFRLRYKALKTLNKVSFCSSIDYEAMIKILMILIKKNRSFQPPEKQYQHNATIYYFYHKNINIIAS
jgi:hypothetical protein